MKLSRGGIDLAKNVYQLHGVDRFGKTMLKRRLKRHQWFKVLLDKTESDCVIGMEACAGAHHWARQLQARGYTVKLIPPPFVKPYIKSNKNDARDAEAICEAMSRPNMRFVTVKTVDQQVTARITSRVTPGNSLTLLQRSNESRRTAKTASIKVKLHR